MVFTRKPMKTAGVRSRWRICAPSGVAASVRRHTAILAATDARFAMTAATISVTAAPSRLPHADPPTRAAWMPATPAMAAAAAAAATRRIRGEVTSRKAVAATPAPAMASRKKWLAVTTIENTTRAG